MPKIIHYFYDDINIWEKNSNPNFRMCYASWLKYCLDYEIKLWSPEMPEFQEILNKSTFVRECYKRKMWAFIADYIRHYALFNYGGVYLDTDVQLVKTLDEYIEKPFFCSIEGDFYNRKNLLESAVIGGQKGHSVFKDMLDIYNSNEIFSINHFIDPIVLTEYFYKKYGFESIDYNQGYKEKAEEYYKTTDKYQLEDIDLYQNQQITKIKDTDIEIYPSEYFCPTWTAFGEKAFTDKTVAIHWNQSSWWKSSKNITEIEAFRYKNPIKNLLYRSSEPIGKFFTWAIPNKNVRRQIRNKIIEKLR